MVVILIWQGCIAGVLRDLMVPGLDWMGSVEFSMIDLYPCVKYVRDDVYIDRIDSFQL